MRWRGACHRHSDRSLPYSRFDPLPLAQRTSRAAVCNRRTARQIPANRYRSMDYRQYRQSRQMTRTGGDDFRNVPEMYPMTFHPKSRRAEIVEFPPFWSDQRDLNPRPLDPQSSALPNCAMVRIAQRQRIHNIAEGANNGRRCARRPLESLLTALLLANIHRDLNR